MTDIEIEAKQLVKSLLQTRLPESQTTLTLLGEFPLNMPYLNVRNGREIGVKSEDTIKFLEKEGVLICHARLQSSGGYQSQPTKFIVSYNKRIAEDFIYTIKHGEFKWDKRDGTWSFKNKSYSFRPGTGGNKLVDMFMELPNKHFTTEEIVKIYSSDRDDEVKRTANDIIRDIKKPLNIPSKYFMPGDGYTFNPYL